MNPLLWKLERVTLSGRPGPRLCDVSLGIGAGVTAVLGHSGAGKTSLLNLLVGFEEPDDGSVQFLREDQETRRHGDTEKGRTQGVNGGPAPCLPRSLSPCLPTMTELERLRLFWLPPDDGLWPHLTVQDHVLAVMPERQGGAIADLLQSFDLSDKSNAYPDQLSQGERARLGLVRALASDAEILVLDEPLVHLDPAGSRRAWEVLRGYLEPPRRTAAVFSTHSPEVVLREAQQVICLSEGRVVYSGSVAQLYYDPPTESLAWCLGSANWINQDEPIEWLSGHSAGRRCYRPEELAVTAAAASPLVVQSTAFSGSIAELEFVDERCGLRRRVFHRPAADWFRAGQRVCVSRIDARAGLSQGEGRSEGRADSDAAAHRELQGTGVVE